MTIQEKFDRAASTYDRYADVQTEVAGRLATLLPDIASEGRIVELGCGTGNFTVKLRHRYPEARIVAVDFACRMVKRAEERLGNGRTMFVCRNIERFLAQGEGETDDLFVSNATLQWLPDLGSVLADLHDRLKPGGVLLCSIFGPQSLSELELALNAVLPDKVQLAAGGFKNRQDLRELLDRHFTVELDEEVTLKRRFGCVLELLRQIGKTGTGSAYRRPLRLSRRHLAAMDEWFAERFGGCVAGYQIFFFRCRK